MDRVISHICGGLGNQMFQYAAGRALSLRLGVPLTINTSWFDNISATETPREFLLSVFPKLQCSIDSHVMSMFNSKLFSRWEFITRHCLPLPQILQAPLVIERNNQFVDLTHLCSPVALKGYWQSESYFKDIQDVIKEDFSFPKFTNERFGYFARKISEAENAVSVHIRRGDYISDPAANAYFAHLSDVYYQNAIAHLSKRHGALDIFVFSDSPEWVQNNFHKIADKYVLVDSKDEDLPHLDMALMSRCKHHIIANSSFSWWGAWLSSQRGETVAPNIWFADDYLKFEKLIPEAWTTL